MPKDYDFGGWASKNNLKCSDGRIIRKDAFKVQDGTDVPIVWNHQHNSIADVLGHARLENRDEGVYVYGKFNDTEHGRHAKECVKHGDVKSLSIWANNLDQVGSDVYHGVIREVSLVLAGANPGAFIESVVSHGMAIDEDDDEGILHTGDDIYVISHAEEKQEPEKEEGKKMEEKDNKKEKTVEEVFDTFNEEQKELVYALVGQALEDGKTFDNDKEEKEMKHNVFEGDDLGAGTSYLSHSDMQKIFSDAKKIGSLKEAVEANLEDGVLAHAIPTTGMTVATGTSTYGFNDPDMLFPDYKAMTTQPDWISREMGWVQKVMSGVHRTPFSRIKSVFANITEDEARARGYIKGKQKKEEVFTTLKRTTDPQTIYKKQKLDRDDIIDIVDFDVVVWIKAEMRIMLDEEIARAILIGDGRQSDSDDKIQESHVRPIANDVALFNTKVAVEVAASATEMEIAKATINAVIRSRKNYKGSGNPVFFTTEDVLTEMLLIEDGIGHKLYKTEAELATALRVREIITVEPMEGHKVALDATKTLPLIGIIVNLTDYNVGADKGGQVELFDDFDIDYNQYKYLIETRISGALVKPFSALTILLDKKTVTPPPTGGGQQPNS